MKNSGNFTPFRSVTLLVVVMLLCACEGKDTDKDGIIDKSDKCITIRGPKPYGCPLPPKIGKINLYLETSASMGGYFNGPTEFKQIISDLAVKIDKEIAVSKIHFVSDTIIDYKGNATMFSTDIATTKIDLARSSELHKMFDRIAKSTTKGDISILVSDCILSFSNAQVKANANVNRDAASGTLKNNIYSTFVDLKRRGQAASLYAFSSKFFGKYYDFQNANISLKGTVRPFYVWVIANNSVLPVFDAKLALIPNFIPEKELHFGLVNTNVHNYHILTQLPKEGSFTITNSGGSISDIGIEDTESSNNHKIKFSAVIDLRTLPPYARNLKYLNENIKVDAKGVSATATITVKPSISKLKQKSQIAFYEEASHLVNIDISKSSLPNALLHVYVPLKYDVWYFDWSTMNDQQVQSVGKKTFAFEHLVKGVTEAYNNEGKNFIDLKFKINQ
jgi:hypothetical protein